MSEDNPRIRKVDLFNGQCPLKKLKEMDNLKIEMQEGIIGTYLVQAEVRFIH